MRRGRTLLALAVVVAVAACGGAVAFDDGSGGDSTVGSRPPRGTGGGRPSFDASRYPYDASMPTCVCDTELEQVDGSCDFTIGSGLIECVADHTDGGYPPLGTSVACKAAADAGASWTPSTTPNELTLCGCTPGETHSLCVKYY